MKIPATLGGEDWCYLRASSPINWEWENLVSGSQSGFIPLPALYAQYLKVSSGCNSARLVAYTSR